MNSDSVLCRMTGERVKSIVFAMALAVTTCVTLAGAAEPEIETTGLAAEVELGAGEVGALLDRVEANLAGLTSLRTRFVQERHLSIFAEPAMSEGVLLYRRPDKVRFEMTRPYKSILVADGRAAARYEYEGGAWRRLDAGDAGVVVIVMRQISSWLDGRLRDDEGMYSISATSGEHETVILTPKDEGLRKYIASIRLALDEGEKRFTSVTIVEPGGDYTLMRFVEEERNVTIPEGAFDTGAKEPYRL